MLDEFSCIARLKANKRKNIKSPQKTASNGGVQTQKRQFPIRIVWVHLGVMSV